jgi:hypothetical protein
MALEEMTCKIFECAWLQMDSGCLILEIFVEWVLRARKGENDIATTGVPAMESARVRLIAMSECGFTQYSTPTKRSRIGPQSHSAEDHRKDSQNKKRTHTPTDNQEPIQDKLFTIITNKVITT